MAKKSKPKGRTGRRPSRSQTTRDEGGSKKQANFHTQSVADDDEPRQADEARASRSESGRYALDSEIARGGMGRVLIGRDTRLGRSVAIKEMLGSGESARLRFDREVKVTARLQHPSILPLYDAGSWRSGVPYYVMRLVTGRPFGECIAEASSLDDRLALLPRFLAATAAVAFAHRQGIIHRDIKPSNILLGEVGETVVIDWGIAKDLRGEIDEPDEAVRPTDSPDATAAGAVLGTPGYMAPEQAVGDPADERSDVYALGATLYQLLCGTAPYCGDDSSQVMAAQLADAPIPLARRTQGVPKDLAAIAARAMQRDPDKRYPDAEQLAADLTSFQTGQLVAAHHYTLAQRVARLARRHRLLLAFAATSVAIIAIVIGISVAQIKTERDAALDAQKLEAARADQLLLARAATHAATDPTKTAALLKLLPVSSPRIGDAALLFGEAQARGIAEKLAGARLSIALEFHPSRDLLLSAGTSRVELFDLSERSPTPRVVASPQEVVTTARFVRGGEQIAVVTKGSGLSIYQLDGARVGNIETADHITQLQSSSDGNVLVWLETSGSVWRADLRNGEQERILASGGESIAASPDGSAVATATAKGVDLQTENGRAFIEETAHSLVFSPGGDRLALATTEAVLEYRLTATQPTLSHRISADIAGQPTFDRGGTLFFTDRFGVVREARDGALREFARGESLARLAPLPSGVAAAFPQHIALPGVRVPLSKSHPGLLRIAASPTRIAAADASGAISLWRTGALQVKTVRVPDATRVAVLDRDYIAVYNREGWHKIRIRDMRVVAKAAASYPLRVRADADYGIAGGRGNVSAIRLSDFTVHALPDDSSRIWMTGRARVTISTGSTLRHRDLETGVDEVVFRGGASIDGLAETHGTIAIATADGDVIWNPGTKRERVLSLGQTVGSLAFTANGDLVIAVARHLLRWSPSQPVPLWLTELPIVGGAVDGVVGGVGATDAGLVAFGGGRAFSQSGDAWSDLEVPTNGSIGFGGRVHLGRGLDRRGVLTDLKNRVSFDLGSDVVAIAARPQIPTFAIIRANGDVELHRRRYPANGDAMKRELQQATSATTGLDVSAVRWPHLAP